MAQIWNWFAPSSESKSDTVMGNNTDSTQTQTTSQIQVGNLYALRGLELCKQDMNGKLCKVVGKMDEKEKRYPILVFETKEVILIKDANLECVKKGTVFISDIIVHPIKGCQGISLQSSKITSYGLQYDRTYVLVVTSTKRNKVLTQSAKPKMCRIQVVSVNDNEIRIKAPGMDNALHVINEYNEKNKIRVPFYSCKDGLIGYDQGDQASEWFMEYLVGVCGYKFNANKKECVRLLLFDPKEKRYTVPKYTTNKVESKESVVSFNNEFQFLVISKESVNGFNARIKTGNEEVKGDRFRPSIILSSNNYYGAHFEDGIKSFSIENQNNKKGVITWHYTKHCCRCGVPQVNQQSGKRSKEPKTTLLKYRNGKILNLKDYQKEADQTRVFFGSYFIHDHDGIIKRGSTIL